MKSGLRNRTEEQTEIVLKKKGNIIYVDFALNSMLETVEKAYGKYCTNDPLKFLKNAHKFHLIRFYDKNRFKNHDTISDERYKYLEEVDLYVQMKRND